MDPIWHSLTKLERAFKGLSYTRKAVFDANVFKEYLKVCT